MQETNDSQHCPGEAEYTPWLYPFDISVSVHQSKETIQLVEPGSVCSHTGKVDTIGLVVSHLDERLAAVPGLGYCHLPGWDEVYHPLVNCGTVRFPVRCPECGYAGLRKNRCYSKACPVCYPNWAYKMARRASKRYWWIFEREPRKWSGNPRNNWHADLTIPLERMHLPWPENLKWACRMMKKLGCRGGVYAGHPWRFRDSNGDPVSWKHSSMNRYAEAPVIESVGILGGHIHVIGWGWLLPSPEAFRRFGVVYTKLSTIENAAEFESCLAYVLTHVGVYAYSQAYRWFGQASYNRVQIESIERETIVAPCPKCGSGLEYLESETQDWLPYEILITRYHYRFRGSQSLISNPPESI